MKYGLCLLLLLFTSFCQAAKLQSVQIQETNNSSEILWRLTFDGPYSYHLFTLSNPSRVVLDLSEVTSAFKQETRSGNTASISKLRVGAPKPKNLRLVLDVEQPMEIVSISPKGGQGSRGELQVKLVPRKVSVTVPAKVAQVKPAAPKPEEKPLPKKPLRDVVIVLDPGHGGKDPGAFGAKKTPEKKVVLAIAKRLKQLIDKQPGMKAVLTRNGDYYLGLRERLEIARKHNADIFVSIHADAFIQSSSRGASVFALSQRGATSEAARWLAEKENYSELGGVNLSELDDQNDVIRTVLIDLSQTATTTASLQMGSQVLSRIDNIAKLHSRKVEQARFVVLKSPDIPSILIETGFISNPGEEKNLNDAKYQAKLTHAIFEGLKQYFWNHPPHGTHIEAMANEKLHVVRVDDAAHVAKRATA